MSRTDKDMPADIQAQDAPHWMRTEFHYWCENETINENRWLRHGRAVYEYETIGYEDVDAEFVKMIDSNKVKFQAEYVTNWRRGRPGTLVYDRDAHPDADYLYKSVWYGQEWMMCRQFSKRTIATPITRRRLVYWEPEPIRKCDIDEPHGECYYRSHLVPSCGCCGGDKEFSNGPRRRRERDMLNYARDEYNTFGYTEHEPPPKIPSDSWW